MTTGAGQLGKTHSDADGALYDHKRGKMSVYKRGEKWGIDYYDSSGKRVKKLIGTKRQAEMAENKLKTERFEEQVMGVKRPDKILFEKMVDEYRNYCFGRNKKHTNKVNNDGINSFLPYFEGQFLTSITIQDVDKYKTDLLNKVKASTVNRYLATLKRIFSLASEWDYLPAGFSAKIKKVKEPPGRIRYLSKDEMRALLDACSADYLYLAVNIALNTGMRKGEILKLTWKDIDLENGYIHIENAKHLRRDIPMNKRIRKLLGSWKKSSETERLFEFDDIKKSFSNALEKAKITNCTFHDLRHTFASWLVMSGVDLATLSKLLGHTSIQMTMRYSHLSPDHKRLAVGKMDDIISKI